MTLIIHCEDYYQILGISRNANEQQIKKAFRKLSQKYHPDLNRAANAQEQFAKINNAYEVLSDKDKRRRYDQYGEEGLKQNLEHHHDPFESMFDMFGGGGRKRDNKGPTLNIKLAVSLEDIYNGKTVEIFMTKQQICPHCRGSGADNYDDIKTCNSCNGKGMTIQKQYIGMGMYQQFQVNCPECNGRGKIVKSKCHVCKSQKVIQGMDTVEITIERGIPDGHQYVLSGASDEFHDKQASDILFKFITIDHPFFIRKRNDLHIIVDIDLKEALLGFSKTVTHLDGHQVQISRNKVTQPGDVDRISDEGMPIHQNPSSFGDLVVTYQVNFPKELTDQQKSQFEQFFKL